MDERDAVRDVNDQPDEEDEGDDLFAEEFEECVSTVSSYDHRCGSLY